MIPLHNHTMFSALDGYSQPGEIADRVEQIGAAGAFLTDHGTVAGWPSFSKTMKERGLFCGYGMEAYQTKGSRETKGTKRGEDSFHLILLAQNQQGYRNLMCLADESNRSGFHYVPRVDWDLLERYSEGIIATSACMSSLICKSLKDDDRKPIDRMLRTFGDNFFIELHTYDSEHQRGLNEKLVEVAVERGIPVVYANDAHYSFPEQYDTHEAFLCAQMATTLHAHKGKKGEVYHDGDPTRYHPQCLYIMSEDEVRSALSNLPENIVEEAIQMSDVIMEACQFELPEIKLHLPKYQIPADSEVDAEEMLMTLVEEGIVAKYGEDAAPEVWDRAAYELKALIGAGLHDYFLIVWDYVQDALREGTFVGPGRGSVGGSIIAYVLDITTIDPLKHNLQFERFWNPGRADGLPDIDIDFEKSGRARVLEKLKRKYGDDRVVPISNHSYLWGKSAIDKAGMVLYDRPPFGVMKRIKEVMEQLEDAGKLPPWEDILDDEEVMEQLSKWATRDDDGWHGEYADLFELAEAFAGRLSTYSIHASAVVISDVDLPEYLPARLAKDDESSGKQLVTQFEMHSVEDYGFPKFDLLRLRNLDTLMRAGQISGEFKSSQSTLAA